MVIIISILLGIVFVYLLVKQIKNKNYKMFICTFIIVVLISFSYFLYTINKDYKIIYNGYISDFENIIISNLDEYSEFMSDSNESYKRYKKKLSSIKYNEKYFEDKSLALIFINTGTSMNKFVGANILTNNDTLIIEPNINYANGTVTTDVTGKLILVEVDKNITNISIQK